MGLWGYQDAFWGSDALRGPETDAAAHHERRSSSRTKRRGDKGGKEARGSIGSSHRRATRAYPGAFRVRCKPASLQARCARPDTDRAERIIMVVLRQGAGRHRAPRRGAIAGLPVFPSMLLATLFTFPSPSSSSLQTFRFEAWL
eukprot:1683995-Rhodomonas_salina.6